MMKLRPASAPSGACPVISRGIGTGIAVELELEVAGTGIFVGVRYSTRTLDLIIETDGMPDCNPFQPPAACEKPRNVAIPQIGRQTRIDAGDILGHAVEKIYAERTQRCVQDRLVDFSRPVGGGERRNILPGAGRELRRDARGVQAERGFKSRTGQVKIARDPE